MALSCLYLLGPITRGFIQILKDGPLKSLLSKIPKSYVLETSLLCSQFIVSGASLDKDKYKNERKETRESIEKCLGEVFSSPRTILANRSFINGSGPEVLNWAFSENTSVEYNNWKRKWLEGAEVIASSESVSVDTRLWAVYPELDFFQKENKGRQYHQR